MRIPDHLVHAFDEIEAWLALGKYGYAVEDLANLPEEAHGKSLEWYFALTEIYWHFRDTKKALEVLAEAYSVAPDKEDFLQRINERPHLALIFEELQKNPTLIQG